jgi:universal stress protein F
MDGVDPMTKILVGLDSSEHAPEVLREAMETARQRNGKLIVVRAVSLPIEFPMEALSVAPDALPARLVSLTQAHLDRAVTSVPAELLEQAEARLGTPWQVLCDAARELKVDLIVIGSHSYGTLDRLLGTTAARVVNHAPCSVLVIRPQGTR